MAPGKRHRGRAGDEARGGYRRGLHSRESGRRRRLNRAHVSKDRQPVDRLLFESARWLYRGVDVILVH